MSLIVAKKIKNSIIITSDTRLTYLESSNIQEHRPSQGTLKTVNIANNVNISFAGNTAYTCKVYEYLYRQKGKLDINKLIDKLLDININSIYEIDFILSVGGLSNLSTKVFSIKNGEVNDSDSAWIGSQQAFSEFQKAYHTCENREKEFIERFSNTTAFGILELIGNHEVDKMYIKSFISMHKVIENTYIEEVGGLVIPCVYNNGTFTFKGYLNCFPIGYNRVKSIKSGDSINLGSASEGSFSVNVSGKSQTVLPVYFPHASLGVVYFSGLSSKLIIPKLFPNMSCLEFKKILDSMNITHSFIEMNFEDNSIKS